MPYVYKSYVITSLFNSILAMLYYSNDGDKRRLKLAQRLMTMY